MINETDRSLRLAGGAVHFQAKHAVEDLGALAFVSSGARMAPDLAIHFTGLAHC